MTEKRFHEHLGMICETKNGEHTILGVLEVVECLNALHEENLALKRTDTIADLETQIMHLKEELDYYKNKCASLETGLINEQRRNSKELDLFHLTKYHEWCNNWKKDMGKHYSDKRRVIKRRICDD